MWANLRGIDSHGVLRVPGYVGRIESGEFNPRPDIAAIAELPAATLIDADRAFGPVGMSRGMDIAIAKAREAGVGVCIVRRVTHMAALGWFALRAVDAGMIGLAFGSSRPNMAYHGARARGVATSPIAIAVPGEDAPVLLDMATSESSMGRIMLARDSGTPLEPGWALTEDGTPTIDADAARMLTPLGGRQGGRARADVRVPHRRAGRPPADRPPRSGRKPRRGTARTGSRSPSTSPPSPSRNAIAGTSPRWPPPSRRFPSPRAMTGSACRASAASA